MVVLLKLKKILVIDEKVTSLQILKFAILCIGLTISSLFIPTVSAACTYILPIIIVIFGYARKLNVSSIASLIILLLFVVYNYVVSYLYGLDGLLNPLSPITIIMSFFLTGIMIDFKKIPYYPLNFVVTNLFLFGGCITWVFVSVIKNSSEIVDRSVPSFWNEGAEVIFGPSLDIFSYLGVSLIGLVLVRSKSLPKNTTQNSILYFLVLPLVLMSSYSAISLSARTPIIVFICSLVVNFIFIQILNRKASNRLKLVIYLLILFLLILIYNYYDLFFGNIFLNAGVGGRFTELGLDSARYEIWLSALNQLFDYPWGGRLMSMPRDEVYMHMIWLDQIYDAGLISGFLLLIFHILQASFIFKFFQLGLPTFLKVFVMCTSVALFAAFIQAPVLQASIVYFGITCFFFATVSTLVYYENPVN